MEIGGNGSLDPGREIPKAAGSFSGARPTHSHPPKKLGSGVRPPPTNRGSVGAWPWKGVSRGKQKLWMKFDYFVKTNNMSGLQPGREAPKVAGEDSFRDGGRGKLLRRRGGSTKKNRPVRDVP